MSMLPSNETWSRCVRQVNDLRKILDDKPPHMKDGYSLHPGSILNAYREGDLSFQEASQILGSEEFCDAMGRLRTAMQMLDGRNAIIISTDHEPIDALRSKTDTSD